jgi:hypothetical protein
VKKDSLLCLPLTDKAAALATATLTELFLLVMLAMQQLVSVRARQM